jgi:thiol-disulfide isomerase/thioredoxin
MKTKPFLLLFLILGIGCASTASTTPVPMAKPVKDIEVSLKEVSATKGWDKAIAEHQGNILVVDVWFLGCAPCVKKFPSFVELYHKHKANNVQFASVDIMFEEIPDTKRVVQFLKDKKAVFPNWIINDTEANRDAWMERIKVVGTPAVLFYDRSGELVKSLENPTPEKIEATIKELQDRK